MGPFEEAHELLEVQREQNVVREKGSYAVSKRTRCHCQQLLYDGLRSGNGREDQGQLRGIRFVFLFSLMGRPCISQRRELLTCNTYTVLCLTQTYHSKGINTSTVLPLNMGVGFNWHARRPLSMSIDNEENYWGGSRLTCIAIISSSLGLGSRAYTSFGNPITHWPHTPFPPQ